MWRAFHRSFQQLSLLALASGFAAGCASNPTEAMNAEGSAACLAATAPVWIASIDGKRVSQTGFTGTKQFRIAPGEHWIEVKYSGSEAHAVRLPDHQLAVQSDDTISLAVMPLKFTALAGHKYYVQSGRMENRWQPHITESPGPVFSDLPVH